MEKQLLQMDFSGGIATTSEKKDLTNTAKFVKNMNIFEDPAYITLSKKTTKVSGSTVDGLVTWAEDGSPFDTNRYFYDQQGKIYQETSSNVWSTLRTVFFFCFFFFFFFDFFLYFLG